MTRMGDSIRRRRGRSPDVRADDSEAAGVTGRASRRPMRWSLWLGGGLAGAGLAFLVGWLIGTTLLFPKPALAGDEIEVPDLSGMSLDEVRELLAGTQLRAGDVREMVHPSARRGEVLAQDPLPGQRLRPGGQVRLAVSQGRARVVVPDLTGMPADAALELARRIGFDVRREDEPTIEAAGRVLRTRPAAGAQEELPAALIVVVSEGGLAPPDTAPAAPTAASDFDDTGLPRLELDSSRRAPRAKPEPNRPRTRDTDFDTDRRQGA